MAKTVPPMVGLAESYTLTENLASDRCLAFKDKFQVIVSCADGRNRRAVFSEKNRSSACPLVWSHDGQTLFIAHEQVCAIRVATADFQAVTNFPEALHHSVHWFLSLSPDGHTLFFRQSLDEPERNLFQTRLCTIGTDGGGFHIVQDDLPDRHIWFVDVHWGSRAVVMSIPRKGGIDYWLTDLEGRDLRILCEAPPRAMTFRLSPDGTALVCSGHQGLHLISLPGGERRELCQAGNAPAWSPDGSRIAFMNQDYELWLLEPASGNFWRMAWLSGRNHPNSRRGGSYATAPVWSQDGRLLWFQLTKTHRLRKPRDPAAGEKFQTSAHYLAMPEAERDGALKRHLERQFWHFSHKWGVLDFQERQAWLTDGYLQSVAWSPLS